MFGQSARTRVLRWTRTPVLSRLPARLPFCAFLALGILVSYSVLGAPVWLGLTGMWVFIGGHAFILEFDRRERSAGRRGLSFLPEPR